MAIVLRRAVSKKKKRFKDDVFDLDLVYVTDRVIAMGFPSEGIEGLYRNKRSDVIKFLDHFHKDRYMVFNLCAETSRAYSPEVFHNRVQRFGFFDHNPPPFEILVNCVLAVGEWLNSDRGNIAAIHCKAGKGRTGCVICCYLIYDSYVTKNEINTRAVMSLYGDARSKNGHGVTISSQMRYIQYFAQALKGPGLREIEEPEVRLRNIRFTNIEKKFLQLFLTISRYIVQDNIIIQMEELYFSELRYDMFAHECGISDVNVIVKGDFLIQFWQSPERKRKYTSCGLHTYFLPSKGTIKLDRPSLDGLSGGSKYGDFSLLVNYQLLEPPATEAVMPPASLMDQPNVARQVAALPIPALQASHGSRHNDPVNEQPPLYYHPSGEIPYTQLRHEFTNLFATPAPVPPMSMYPVPAAEPLAMYALPKVRSPRLPDHCHSTMAFPTYRPPIKRYTTDQDPAQELKFDQIMLQEAQDPRKCYSLANPYSEYGFQVQNPIPPPIPLRETGRYQNWMNNARLTYPPPGRYNDYPVDSIARYSPIPLMPDSVLFV